MILTPFSPSFFLISFHMPIQLLLGFEGFLTVFAFVAHQVQSFVCSCVVVVDGFVAADFTLVVAPHVFGQQVVRSFADFFRVVKVFSRRVPFVSRTRTKFRRKIFIFELSLFFDLRFYDSVGMIYICESPFLIPHFFSRNVVYF